MNVLFCSCVILINKNNEILICQRPKGKYMYGFWEFPGGKVKNSEKFNYAAIREIQEELNIKIDAKDINFLMNIFYEYSDFFLSMQVYFTDQWQGKIKAMEKQKFKWIKKETLKDIDMLPASKKIIQKIMKNKNF